MQIDIDVVRTIFIVDLFIISFENNSIILMSAIIGEIKPGISQYLMKT